jgi:hypothetical protein
MTKVIDQIVEDEIDQQMMDYCGFVYCPCCGIHLDNGISQHDPIEQDQWTREYLYKNDKFEYACLACGEEFGPEIEKDEPKKAVKKTGKAHPKNMNLKAMCFATFDQSICVAEVAAKFDITYGNAHYHYRNWKKSQKVESV